MISKIGKIEVVCREDEMYNATDFLEKWNIQNPNKIKLIEDYFKFKVTNDFLEIIKNDNSFFLEIPPYLKEKKDNKEIIWMHPYLFTNLILWVDYKFEYTMLKQFAENMLE